MDAGFLLCWSSTLKMDVKYYFETLVCMRTIRIYIPENGDIHYFTWIQHLQLLGEGRNLWSSLFSIFRQSPSYFILPLSNLL
jgi:hypothetical protein